MDTLSKAERSKIMSLVRNKDTRPEMKVRKLVHGMGYRYRLHGRKLPGKPDLVFRSRKKVIFIHGCFWHRHDSCKLARMPKSRQDYWEPKLEGNKTRDELNQEKLRDMGWDSLVIWECEIKDADGVAEKVAAFLSDEKGDDDEVG